MTAEIISLTGRQPIGEGISLSPDQVLDGAKGNLQSAVVIGVDASGEIYVASSDGQPEAMALIDLAKRWMLNQIAELRGWD